MKLIIAACMVLSLFLLGFSIMFGNTLTVLASFSIGMALAAAYPLTN